MNRAKAAYFDTQATAPWAVDPFPEKDRPKIARLLTAAEIQPGMHVLEPGCGTGRLTTILAEAVGPYGGVLALDISAAMAQACRDRIGERTNVRVVQAAIEDYAVETDHFDVVVCHQVVPHFDDPPAAFATIMCGLKPGGRLVVVHFAPAAVINAIHRTAAPPIQQDHLPPPERMRALLMEARLVVDWCTEDALGYLVRGTRKKISE
jgi:demethylmenaquinone methyltransferase/2-methoxy-6-polyprenyl-1,4-benzoquinol methylase